MQNRSFCKPVCFKLFQWCLVKNSIIFAGCSFFLFESIPYNFSVQYTVQVLWSIPLHKTANFSFYFYKERLGEFEYVLASEFFNPRRCFSLNIHIKVKIIKIYKISCCLLIIYIHINLCFGGNQGNQTSSFSYNWSKSVWIFPFKKCSAVQVVSIFQLFYLSRQFYINNKVENIASREEMPSSSLWTSILKRKYNNE